MRQFDFLVVSIILFAQTAAQAEPGATTSNWKAFLKAGDESFSIGDFAAAETKFRSALDMTPSRNVIPALQIKYANSLMCQGNFKLATKEMKKTLSLAKSISGTDSTDYGEALDLQSWLLQAKGKNEAAIATLANAMPILESKAAGSSDLADAYEHMGLLNETAGLFDPAKENYEKARDIRSKLSGVNGVEVADMDEALGRVAAKRGQTSEASRLFEISLRIKESRGEPWKKFAAEATERKVIFRYNPSAANCRQGSYEGSNLQRITANGITVEAGLSQKPSSFSNTTRSMVRIGNHSDYDVDVLSQAPTFIQMTPEVQILKPIDPQTLASKIEKKGESKAKWIKFWGADAMTQVSSYSQGNGMPMYSSVPSAFGWNSNNSYGRNNSWSSNQVMMVPDYQRRAEAYQKAQEATSKSKSDAEDVLGTALGPNRLQAANSVEGTLDFEFSKYKTAILRIPIGNSIFEFRFE